MPEKVSNSLYIENFKISLLPVHTDSICSRQQYLHYSNLVVLCSMLWFVLRPAIWDICDPTCIPVQNAIRNLIYSYLHH